MGIDGILRSYLLQLRANGRSPHTVKQAERHLLLFTRWAREVAHVGDVRAITPEVLAAFLAADTARLRPDGILKKPGSMNTLRSSLRSFFKYLSDCGHLDGDPARMIQHARCAPPPPRAMSDAEIERLRSALAEDSRPAARRDAVLIELMLSTGMRIGSALNLRVEDIDFDAQLAWVRSSKGSRDLRIFLNGSMTTMLREWLDDRATGPLFNITTRQAQRRFAAWVERARLRPGISLHSLRHTFATRLYETTGDVLLVREALHHRSVTSTMIYARCDDARLRRALEQDTVVVVKHHRHP